MPGTVGPGPATVHLKAVPTDDGLAPGHRQPHPVAGLQQGQKAVMGDLFVHRDAKMTVAGGIPVKLPRGDIPRPHPDPGPVQGQAQAHLLKPAGLGGLTGGPHGEVLRQRRSRQRPHGTRASAPQRSTSRRQVREHGGARRRRSAPTGGGPPAASLPGPATAPKGRSSIALNPPKMLRRDGRMGRLTNPPSSMAIDLGPLTAALTKGSAWSHPTVVIHRTKLAQPPAGGESPPRNKAYPDGNFFPTGGNWLGARPNRCLNARDRLLPWR